MKNHPNTNTNIIRFWKITRIRIRILFGFEKSPEYEYEYHYSVSTIRILFEYRIIRSPLMGLRVSGNLTVHKINQNVLSAILGIYLRNPKHDTMRERCQRLLHGPVFFLALSRIEIFSSLLPLSVNASELHFQCSFQGYPTWRCLACT